MRCFPLGRGDVLALARQGGAAAPPLLRGNVPRPPLPRRARAVPAMRDPLLFPRAWTSSARPPSRSRMDVPQFTGF